MSGLQTSEGVREGATVVFVAEKAVRTREVIAIELPANFDAFAVGLSERSLCSGDKQAEGARM